jgi:hypothetical protein
MQVKETQSVRVAPLIIRFDCFICIRQWSPLDKHLFSQTLLRSSGSLTTVILNNCIYLMKLFVAETTTSMQFVSTLPSTLTSSESAACAPGEEYLLYQYEDSEGFNLTSTDGLISTDPRRALHGSGWSLELPEEIITYRLQIVRQVAPYWFRFTRIRLFSVFVRMINFTLYDLSSRVLVEKQVRNQSGSGNLKMKVVLVDISEKILYVICGFCRTLPQKIERRKRLQINLTKTYTLFILRLQVLHTQL